MYGIDNNSNSTATEWVIYQCPAAAIRILIDPPFSTAYDDLAQKVDKFVSESQKRLAALLEWTRQALAFWRIEHRRPVRVARPVVRLPERSRVCSLAEAWRVRGPP